MPSILRHAWLMPLVIAAAALALVAAMLGLFWPGGDGVTTVITWRGETVDLFGEGVYREYTLFHGAAARGSDAVTLLIVLPLLAVGVILARRGSLRGLMLTLGGLTWLLYVYVTLALGQVYTPLFLLYVAAFGTSLWALLAMLVGVDRERLRRAILPGMPRRGPGLFLVASGVVTALIWLVEPVAALIDGEVPASLETASTLFTYGLDLAVIAPAVIVAGVLVLRGEAFGYLAGLPLMILEALLAPMIVAQTLFQLNAGVEYTAGEVIGPIAGFVVLAVIALGMILRVMRHIDDDMPARAPRRTRGTAASANA